LFVRLVSARLVQPEGLRARSKKQSEEKENFMQKTMTLALVLLGSVALSYGQSSASQSAQIMPGPASVEGCLQASNGSYTLTVASGTVYQLNGNNSMLQKHVGHEVRVTGSTPGTNAASTPSAATPGGSQQTILNVKNIKHISGTCSSTAKQ
jgi:hypothetical protein